MLTVFSCFESPAKMGKSIDDIHIKKAEYYLSENISIYFTDPPYDTDIDETLISKIDAINTGALYLCLYDFDHSSIIKSIIRAVERGVNVYFIGDIDEYEKDCGYKELQQAMDIKYPDDAPHNESGNVRYQLLYRSGIMHNKFILFHNYENGLKSVWTGSTNISENDFSLNNNNAVAVKSSELFDIYLKQFQFLAGESKYPVSELSSVIIDGIPIEIYFSYRKSGRSSENLPSSIVSNSIYNAESSINFMIFTFTHPEIINAVSSKHTAGISVNGIFDDFQSSNRKTFNILKGIGMDIKKDGNTNALKKGGGGMLHHKVIIIDYDSLTNAKVITGSYNFTDAADFDNAENIMIIYSKDAAHLFYNEFTKRWKEGKQ